MLDIFGGSGSTLIAAETCGRKSYLLEYEPAYCDTIIERWQGFTGKQAVLADSGQNFEAVAEGRAVMLPSKALPAGPVRRRRHVR